VGNTGVDEEISRYLEQCLATLPEVETGLSRVVMAALYEQNIELIQTVDTWLSHFLSYGFLEKYAAYNSRVNLIS
jgi:hypothetical protein